ncbi:barstar family protein, partial [Paenarthrobacter sp. NCHU4564]
MKIYSADTWTLEELQAQVADAGRRTILVPPAETKKAVLEVFGQVLDFPEYYGVNLDALNDSLHDFADSLSDDGDGPVTMIWQVPAAYRTDRSFGVVCEI